MAVRLKEHVWILTNLFYGIVNTRVLSGHQYPRVTMLMKLKRRFTLMSVSSPFVMLRANQREA